MRRASLPPPLWLPLLLLAGSLGGCAGWFGKGSTDNAPTLATLAGKSVQVAPDAGVHSSEEQAIAAYTEFLRAAPDSPWRGVAMRRIGDLEMDRADSRAADDARGGTPDYRAAVARYRAYLQAYPNDPHNDQVLYQLARASEQSGDLDGALRTLDALVRQYPAADHLGEAQFRRGELLFTLRDYPRAEAAYAEVLRGGAANPYYGRARYMEGWSRFKQGRLDEALQSFFAVLDGKAALLDAGDAGRTGRADREMLDDTLRVTSLSLSQLQGAQSIPPFIDSPLRRDYAFRVYDALAALYVKQERVKDAADTYAAFVAHFPAHGRAPQMNARVVEVYADGGFATLALQAKQDFVVRYGPEGDYRQRQPEAWQAAQPRVRTYLAALAQHYHAAAQAGKQPADYQQAVHWYRAYLAAFPDGAAAAQHRFLLAELLFEQQRFAEAATEYEHAAYDGAAHPRAADAGYAALLARAADEAQHPAGERPALQRAAADSALRFAAAFPADARAAPVLADAAEKLFALGDAGRASAVARQLLARDPRPTPPQQRVAWTVVAHGAFDARRFDAAEQAYVQALALLPAQDPGRAALQERLAASVYKQGETARDAGQPRQAAAAFERVAAVAPDSPVRAAAQFDAAASWIELKDWAAAARTLEDFERRFPDHALRADADRKLAAAYLELRQWPKAAAQLERLAADTAATADAAAARAALWHAAELYDKAAAAADAARVYADYVRRFPQPLQPAIEARWRQSQLAHAAGDGAAEQQLQRDIVAADQAGGDARTPRTRLLAAQASLALAEPLAAAYRSVALTEPLQRQLKLKKARLEQALQAYGAASDYGVAEVSTAATFEVAALYQDFGKALLDSQRPARLSKAAREQYDVMLEEQAFPFEEKAIALHELNTARAAQGLYDRWVQRSFAALRELKPARYAKNERSEGVIDVIR